MSDDGRHVHQVQVTLGFLTGEQIRLPAEVFADHALAKAKEAQVRQVISATLEEVPELRGMLAVLGIAQVGVSTVTHEVHHAASVILA